MSIDGQEFQDWPEELACCQKKEIELVARFPLAVAPDGPFASPDYGPVLISLLWVDPSARANMLPMRGFLEEDWQESRSTEHLMRIQQQQRRKKENADESPADRVRILRGQLAVPTTPGNYHLIVACPDSHLTGIVYRDLPAGVQPGKLRILRKISVTLTQTSP